MSVTASNRRSFLTRVLAASLIPHATWADAGAPAYLSGAALPDGSFVLCGISASLDVMFKIPLPDRGHAAAAHPTRPEAVAFARRPGTFAIVIDCRTGRPTARLEAPVRYHFYGHGTYSADGNWLFTTENDYEAGRGRVGLWDVAAGYVRAGEFSSGGVGPHDIKRIPNGEVLVVANGGIDTHPETGRTKLNIPTMAPNISYIMDGKVIEVAELEPNLHKNSIRHLAVSPNGLVAFGMQWQGDTDVIGLVGTHRRGTAPTLLETPSAQVRSMQGYIGSIALSADGDTIAVTSSRGGLVQTFDTGMGRYKKSMSFKDVGGIAPSDHGFIATSGLGKLVTVDRVTNRMATRQALAWDNHLVAIQS